MIDATILPPLPYPVPEQLVEIDVEHRAPNGRASRYAPSFDGVPARNAANAGFRHIAIERSVFPTAIFDAGVPERVESIKVASASSGTGGPRTPSWRVRPEEPVMVERVQGGDLHPQDDSPH